MNKKLKLYDWLIPKIDEQLRIFMIFLIVALILGLNVGVFI